MAQLRHRLIVGAGSYTDEYSDQYLPADAVYIAFRRHYNSWAPNQRISSVFEGDAELEEYPDIWAAIQTVWDQIGTYDSQEDIVTAMDAALSAAGYTAPGGVAL